ncbi:MAG TPA: hypothetical protein VGG19_18030 [Tepidisphaeraceae bacterium]|jgi:hypothetical protein
MTAITPPLSLSRTRVTTQWNLRYVLRCATIWLCFCGFLAAGVAVRRWVWVHSTDIRFKGDIDNGFHRGLQVNQSQQTDFTRAPTWKEFFAGYHAIYQQEKDHPSGWMKFDYSPMRLLVMSVWVHGILASDPGAAGWVDRDVSPLLWFNTICALISAIGVYLLVRQWMLRRAAAHPENPPRAITLRAWAAALCLWFNPAVLLDAHVWPQWDIWCVPFFIWAIFAGSSGGWFWTGVLIALGAMFKGQILIVAPAILVWCIFVGGIFQTALMILGMLTVGVLIGSIWLLPTGTAWAALVVFVTLAALIGLLLSKRLRNKWVYYMAALLCVGLILGAWYFNGSLVWLHTSFDGAADNFRVLRLDAITFAGTLAYRWGWQIDDPVFTWHTHVVTMNYLLRGIYIGLMLLCGIAAALQTRRRDPRVLVALIAPWILMFALLPQMHERYLMWGAAVAAIGVGINLELTILFLITTAIACASILVPIYHVGPLAQFIDHLDPDIGWVVLFLALAYFYQGWKRDRAFV